MQSKWMQVTIAATCVMLMAAEKHKVAPQPENGFVNAAHEAFYVKYEMEISSIDAEQRSDHVLIDRAFATTLADLFQRIALVDNVDRVRRLKKIADGWIDDDRKTVINGKVPEETIVVYAYKIEGEIPEELKAVVDDYRAASRNVDVAREDSRRANYNRLIRKVDAYATTHATDPFLLPNGPKIARVLRKEARSLMPAAVKPEKWGELEQTSFDWAYGDPHFIRMQVKGDELLTLARLRGCFAGGGESIHIGSWDEGTAMGLEGGSMQRDVQATAFALRHPRLKLDDWKVRTHQINSGDPKVKLLHKSRGFCYLGGLSGHWAGPLGTCQVSLNPKDGFYYLSVRNESASAGARAIIVEYPEGVDLPDFEFTTARWNRGEPAQELIDAKDGICLLSGLNGAIKGIGEEINLTIGGNGKWRLGGRSKQPGTGASVLVIQFKETIPKK